MSHNSIERWLPVVGYEGLYEVSDHGRVRTVDRVEVTKAGYTRRRKSKLRSPWSDKDGYMHVTVTRNRRKSGRSVHRLVLEAFVGPCPDNMVACHDNGDPADNRLQNLRWDTLSANELDKVTHGTHHNARKTHCPRGHLLEAPNLAHAALKRGRRVCKACNRAHASVTRRPELRPDFQQISDNHYRAITSVDG